MHFGLHTAHSGYEATTVSHRDPAAPVVVKLVMLRLLAPYLGLASKTNTLVIGMALTAIALGSWAGGRMADLVPAERTLTEAT